MSVVSGVDVSASPLSDGITSALQSAPELISTPGLALDAGGSLDPTTFSPVVSHLTNVQQTAQAAAQANTDTTPQDKGGGGGGFFSAIGHAFQSIPGIHGVEHALGTVAHYAAAPLREIQRDYRFVHMVWTKNGPVAGILATLGVTAAAGLGAYAGGPEGAVLGAEAAGYGERVGASDGMFGTQLRQTAALSQDPNVKISIGRDFANALGQVPGLGTLRNTNKGFGKLVSGGTDAFADWELDPTASLAKFKTGLKLGDYGTASKAAATARVAASRGEQVGNAKKIMNAAQQVFSGDLLRTMQSDSAAQFFDKLAPGIRITPGNSEQLEQLYNAGIAGASYRRALSHIATLNSGEIVARYPELEPLAANVLKASDGTTTLKGLGAAQTAEQAHQVFVNAAENQNFADRLNSLAVVPTRTLTRAVGSNVAEWAKGIDSNAATKEVAGPEGSTSTLQVRAQPRPTIGGGIASAGANLATGNFGAAKDAITGAIARKISTFSGYLPFSLDKNTLDLSSKTFSVDAATQRVAPTAAKGILNSFRFSMGEQRARYWADQFINAPDLASQKRIWAEANFELLKAAGLPDDNTLVQNIRSQLADINAGPMGEPKNVYGVGAEKGTDVSLQPAGDSWTPAALWNHQATAEFSFPDFAVLKQEQRKLQGAIKANYGRFDDFAARKYVGSIFKPLALLNAGFGFRVAMAEAIPQAMREGAMQTLRDAVNAKAANIDYKLNQGEDAHILAAAAHALSDPDTYEGPAYTGRQVFAAQRRTLIRKGESSLFNGVNRLLNDPIARDRALDLIMRHQGHIAVGVARTGESTGGWSIDQDPASKAQIGAYTVKSELKNDPRIKWAGSKDFDTFTRDADVYDGYWHNALSRISQEKPAQMIAADLLNGGKLPAPSIDEIKHLIPAWVAQESDLRDQSARALGGDLSPLTAEARKTHAVIANSPKTTEPLHRGVVGPYADELAKLGPGSPLTVPVSSFSSDEDVAHFFSQPDKRFTNPNGAILHLAPGARALPLGTSSLEHEKESLVAGHFAVSHIVNGEDGRLHVHIKPNAKQFPSGGGGVAAGLATRAEAQRIQDAVDENPNALPQYLYESKALRGYDNIKARNWTAQDFAANRVDALRGLTEGADGTVHTAILRNIAAGEKPALEDLADIGKESRPVQAYGPERVPYIGNNLMQRVISQGFVKVVDPIINGLSRDPMYFNEYSRQMDLLDPAVKSGHLDEETAKRIAETRSVVQILPKIHNTALRSQFSVLARNYMPFYFAQEQALRRAGKLIATNPAALRQYQLVSQGLNDPGFVQKDDQGNRFFVFPPIGALASGADGMMTLFGDSVQAGLPMSVQGSMSSLNTLLPDFNQPGVSPLVSLPLNKLAGLFPELAPDVKAVTGSAGFGQSSFDALVPNTFAKAAWRVMNPDEKDATFANALFTAMTTSFYQGTAPGPDASDSEKANWINRMKNNARTTFIVKAALGLVSPLAPQVQDQTEAESQFKTEFYNNVKKVGYAQALQDFLAKHGTNAISYTVAHSQPAINGAYLPYTQQALNAINGDLAPLINSKYATGAAFLVPQAQGPGDVQTIHSELIRQHLRTVDTPQQFLDAIDIALGNNAISPDLKVHEAAQAQLANDPTALAAENKNWSEYMQVQHINNPTWYDYWSSPQRTNLAYQAWVDLREIYNMADKNGNPLPATQTQQGQIVRQLLEDYANHALAMSQSATSAQRTQERANWKAYLDDEAKKNPLAYSVINAVFARLDSAGVTPNGTVA